MSPSAVRVLVGGAAMIIILIGMKYAAEIVNPVILAFVITLAVSPLLHWQIRKGVPSSVAYVTTMLVTIIAGLALVGVAAVSLARLINQLPTYAASIKSTKQDLVSWLQSLGIDISSLTNRPTMEPSNLVDTAKHLAASVLSALSAVSVIVLTFFFMLAEATTFAHRFKAGAGPTGLLQRSDGLTRDVRAFIKVQVWLGAVAAILETIILLILGVDFAFLWGIVSFVFSFVPYIGFVAALIPPTLIALLSQGWVSALIVVIAYIVVNTLSDSIVKPGVMGKQTNLSPLTVFLSLILWAWVLGPVGGLLAVPLTLIVRTMFLDAYQESQWLSDFMTQVKQTTERTRGRLRRRKSRTDEASG